MAKNRHFLGIRRQIRIAPLPVRVAGGIADQMQRRGLHRQAQNAERPVEPGHVDHQRDFPDLRHLPGRYPSRIADGDAFGAQFRMTGEQMGVQRARDFNGPSRATRDESNHRAAKQARIDAGGKSNGRDSRDRGAPHECDEDAAGDHPRAHGARNVMDSAAAARLYPLPAELRRIPHPRSEARRGRCRWST